MASDSGAGRLVSGLAARSGGAAGRSPGADARVVVVGAGVIGCAVAEALAPAVEVFVFERDQIGSGATGLSAGEVTVAPAYSDHRQIASFATEFFKQLSGTRGFTFKERESVEFVPPDRLGEARRRAGRLAGSGLATEFLGWVDAETDYPIFDLGDYVGLVRHEDAGFLDPTQLVNLLATRARRSGATIETKTAAKSLVVEDDAVVGVETDDGVIGADVVVVAAGWRTPRLLADQVTLPVRPYRTQAAVVEIPRLGDWTGDVPMGWVPERRVYFRPMTDTRVLVGGFADPIDEPAAASRDADPAFRRHVAELVPQLFADAGGSRLVDDWAGVDLATPDTRPIIDAPAGGPQSLLVATGFHGRGVMTAPVAGAVARARILGADLPFSLAPFDAERFDAASPEFPFFSSSAGREV